MGKRLKRSKIQLALRNARAGATKLNLSYARLQALPSGICSLSHLTQLILTHNRLSELPPGIGKLVNLKVLGLSDNRLRTFTPEIAQLVNLTQLYLSRNKLKALPPEIGQLANLKGLALTDNQLSALPKEIGQLTNLTRLYLANNHLSTLPLEMSRLAKLNTLDLHGNPLPILENIPRKYRKKPNVIINAYLQHMTPQKHLKVFLCHASDDKPAVRKLYQRLKADNIDPWLDEENLIPGQEWGLEILKAVRAADVVIVCLSAKSITKEGYVQKEIRYALDVADEKPEGTIFLIPLRLEECRVPTRLSRWQWIDYYEDQGYERLIMALKARAETLVAASPKTATINAPSEIHSPYTARTNSVISILFLAADPTDATRLRLGEELREIQEKLKLAKLRERFELHQRMSIRPVDISQALLDVQPQIVHFSGHGRATGELCFENQVGKTHPIQPEALAALFEQFAHQVNCVLLNACYSETQAKAIAAHIDYVIGMNQAIGDKAAIAFAIGFYQALGASRTVEEAYKLGCVQIRLQSIAEHLTPVLIKKGQTQS